MIGYPVAHSRSPAIHNAAARALGIDLEYTAIAVLPGEVEAAIAEMRTAGFRGLSVTMPHKEAVMAHLDELTTAATDLRAVNHITNTDGHLVGNNTDGEGFLLGLAYEHDLHVAGKSIGVVGSGGAARAIIRACALGGASNIAVIGRNPERAAAAASVGAGTATSVGHDKLPELEVVVNATPLGMRGTAGEALQPFDVNVLDSAAVVVDIVYDPLETALLRAARSRGLVGINGLSMLAGQASAQFEAWTGTAPPLGVMIDAAAGRLDAPDEGRKPNSSSP